MFRFAWMLVAGLPLVLAAAGCGTSDSGDASEGAGSARDNRRPEEVVRVFCEGLRGGDKATVDAMLTAAARKHNVLTPQKTDTQFTVGKSVYQSESQAEVETTWTTLDERGKPFINAAVWTLRLEAEGWRVFGMKTTEAELVKNRIVALNFEEPDQVARTREAVYQERVALGLEQGPAAREEIADRPSTVEPDNRRE
jgi:hypothetical protein